MSDPSANFDLHVDDWGRLVLVAADGRRHVGVISVRAFPISNPEQWISICDTTGREVQCVEDPASLPPAVRQVLEDDLARREFVPVIRRILSVSGDFDPCEWDVETDRGPVRFVLKDEDEIRRLGPHRSLIVDAQGIRYLIEDSRALDPASRQIIDRFI